VLLLCSDNRESVLFHSNTFAEVFYIESSDIDKTLLFPGLHLFRVTDHEDSQHRLHHGYQVLFIGDPEMAIEEGMLSCTLINETQLEICVPGTVASFFKDYASTHRILKQKKKTSKPARVAHSIVISRFQEDPSLMQLKYLIDVSRTGETLTNTVFTPGSERFGPVRPKSSLIERVFHRGSTQHVTTDLYAAFNVARVEKTIRKALVTEKQRSTNLVADDLDEDGDEDGDGTNEGAARMDTGSGDY